MQHSSAAVGRGVAFVGALRVEPAQGLHALARERLAAPAQGGTWRALSMSDVTPKAGTVSVTIVDPVTAKDGKEVQARIGASVLDIAQEHDMVSNRRMPCPSQGAARACGASRVQLCVHGWLAWHRRGFQFLGLTKRRAVSGARGRVRGHAGM